MIINAALQVSSCKAVFYRNKDRNDKKAIFCFKVRKYYRYYE